MTTAAAVTLPLKESKTQKAWLLLVLVFALTIYTHYRIAGKENKRDSVIAQIVFLPAAGYLKPLSLGYNALLADFIYLWSIQYYGDPLFHPQMQFLPRTYELITDLDPQYIDAYEAGALFLSYEGRNPKGALKLLDKGLEKNPEEWILPMDAGFYSLYNLHDKDLSVKYFQKAAEVPGAPTFPKRMQAGVEFRKGDKRVALQLWSDVYDHADSATVKQTAFQHVHDLKALIDVEELQKAVEAFNRRIGRFPFNFSQLLSGGFVTQIPKDPEGNDYQYDPRTGAVKYSKQLKLYNRFQ